MDHDLEEDMKTKRDETTMAVVAALKARQKQLQGELANVEKALAIFNESGAETKTRKARTGKKPGPKPGTKKVQTQAKTKKETAAAPVKAGNGALSKKERAAMLRGDAQLRPQAS